MKTNFFLDGNMKTKSLLLIFLNITLLSLLFGFGCGPKAPQIILDAEDQYTVAKREFNKKHWDQAVIELQKLILNYPGSGFIDTAQYLLGMSYFNQKEYPLAIGEFNRLLSSYPTSLLADDAAFKVAESDFKMSPRAELDQEHTQKAMDELKNFADDYPQSDRKDEALQLINKCKTKLAFKVYKAGDLYYKMRHYPSALIYFQQVLNEYYDTEWAKPAQFQLAEVLYKDKKFDQAKEEYQKFLEKFPNDELAKKANRRLEKIVKNLAASSVEKSQTDRK
jgi:outer membrane protein assembly factor BamD